jgi:hypothetical protein
MPRRVDALTICVAGMKQHRPGFPRGTSFVFMFSVLFIQSVRQLTLTGIHSHLRSARTHSISYLFLLTMRVRVTVLSVHIPFPMLPLPTSCPLFTRPLPGPYRVTQARTRTEETTWHD